MITFQKAFRAADGKLYESLEEAQAAEIDWILFPEPDRWPGLKARDVANLVVAHKQEIQDVLSTSESSRPKARRLHGGTKRSRKTKFVPASETAA